MNRRHFSRFFPKVKSPFFKCEFTKEVLALPEHCIVLKENLLAVVLFVVLIGGLVGTNLVFYLPTKSPIFLSNDASEKEQECNSSITKFLRNLLEKH